MKRIAELDRRPVLVAIAGPNGAGKTTFYEAHIAPAGLRFVNADVIAHQLGSDPYAAAKSADVMRRAMVRRKESFAFETVFSDPVGDKLKFLQEVAEVGYTVVLCFIGISSPELSEERVAMRVSQGGHDVPSEKLQSRFPRTLENLKAALRTLPFVFVYDNSDLARAYREVAVFTNGRLIRKSTVVPAWFRPLVNATAHKGIPPRSRRKSRA